MELSLHIEKDNGAHGSVCSSPTAASSQFPSMPNSPLHGPRRRPPTRRRTQFTASPEGSLLVVPGPGAVNDGSLPAHPITPLPVHADASILSSLHALHADELVYLFKNRDKVLGDHQYRHHVRSMLQHYFYFLWFTWSRAIWNIIMLPTSALPHV